MTPQQFIEKFREMVGVVEEVGSEVCNVKAGDHPHTDRGHDAWL